MVVAVTVTLPVVGGGAVTLKVELVAPFRPEVDAVSVYPFPALLMLKPVNVATPLPNAPDAVPESVPPPGLVPMASAAVPLKAVTTVPVESTAATVIVPSEPPVCADCG